MALFKDAVKENSFNVKKAALTDFLIPVVFVSLLALIAERVLSRPLLKWTLDLPYVGTSFYKSPVYYIYLEYWFRFSLVLAPLFLLWFGISWGNIRIPGPGRPLRKWWIGLARKEVKEESFIDPFPPDFSHKDIEVKIEKSKWFRKDPLARIIGYIKRFRSDIEKDEREGKEPEGFEEYYPLVFDEMSRYRHIQIVGGSGSGKSASGIAPMLKEDALTSKIATLTLNPKADLYLIKVMVDGVRKRLLHDPDDNLPTAVVSFVRKQSLSYDPLLYGDADALTKKIIYSAEMTNEFYRAFQETWLMSFFRVVKTERQLVGRIMLRHLHRFLCKPSLLIDELLPLCEHEVNQHRLKILSASKPDSLAGVASHVSQLVEDESLSHVFDNPEGRYLDLRDVLKKGGNIFIEVDNASKGPQGRALGRMIIMELQLFSGARQAGHEPMDIGVQAYLDEFASFAYNGFIDLIDKCRSAKIGLLLAHQSVANLERDNLSRSFKSEIVDNTYSKIFLDTKDETAEWAAKQFGKQTVLKKSLSLGQNMDATDVKVREMQNVSYREEREDYLVPSDFKLPLGSGYAMVGDEKGNLRTGPCKLGYIDDADLCRDEELLDFLQDAKKLHPKRPRNGSLIDNDIPPGEPHENVSSPTTLDSSKIFSSEDVNKHMDKETLERVLSEIENKPKKQEKTKKIEKKSTNVAVPEMKEIEEKTDLNQLNDPSSNEEISEAVKAEEADVQIQDKDVEQNPTFDEDEGW